MGLGSYPAIGLAKARVMHAGAKEILAKGADPGADQTERQRAERQRAERQRAERQRAERQRAERNAETVFDLADEYPGA